jgi:3-hydroxypropanoate dehydrogenase
MTDHVAAIRDQKAALPELGADAQGLLFTHAHTNHAWTERPVQDGTIARALDLAGLGPTAFNQQPLRALIVRSPEAKARLAPAMSEANREKTLAAPATAILCADLRFFDRLPELWPGKDVSGIYRDAPDGGAASARLNATLQAGYLILALRGVGLDVGPMAGFNRAAVAETFLQGRHWDVLFLLNIGYGDPEAVRPRNPRLGAAGMSETL